jgi:hypothetical protein
LHLPIEKTKPVNIPKFETSPVIDGKLDEAIWKTAAIFKDFYQTHPGDNLEPSRDTKVMMGYDSKNIYLAVYAYDEPDKIRASLAQRDAILNEDNFRFFFDTFNDQRRAYVISFNPFGIQTDGIMTEGGGTDFNVDIVMESKGQIFAVSRLEENKQGYAVVAKKLTINGRKVKSYPRIGRMRKMTRMRRIQTI